MASKKAKHSVNYEKVKRFYDKGLWSKEKVRNAVVNPESNPWITKAEYEEITGESYEEA